MEGRSSAWRKTQAQHDVAGPAIILAKTGSGHALILPSRAAPTTRSRLISGPQPHHVNASCRT